MIRKQAVDRIRRKAGEACIAIREEAERLILALEWEELLDSTKKEDVMHPWMFELCPESDCDRKIGHSGPHFALAKPISCSKHHWQGAIAGETCPACELEKQAWGNYDSSTPKQIPKDSNMTRCKACNKEIYVGNCCGESCTKEWLAQIEQAHRDKSKGRRHCRQCGAAHEMKSNFCGECDQG